MAEPLSDTSAPLLMRVDRVNECTLYVVYAATCLEDRAWSFCVSLCMQLLGGMQLVSIEQLCEGVAQSLLSGPIGAWCDRVSRSRALLAVIPCNNLSVIAACAAFIGCLSIDSQAWHMVLLLTGMLFCSLNRLALSAEKSILSRDWLVVLTHNDETKLPKLNAITTTIDQLANVGSPLLTGVLVTWIGLRWTCSIFGAGAICTALIKAVLLSRLYSAEKQLHSRQHNDQEEDGAMQAPSIGFLRSLRVYLRQDILPAALGMALLFMTVLGFDGLAVGYGSSNGLPEAVLGAFRSVGAAAGVAGALGYALVQRSAGVRMTGVIGLGAQQVCLLLAVSSILMPASPFHLTTYFSTFSADSWWAQLKSSFTNANKDDVTTDIGDVDWKHFKSADGRSLWSIFAFLTGIALARFGLWTADLSITHVMQTGVAERERNTVFGVHNALCQFFSVLKDVLVILLPLPSTFGVCMLVSYGFVTTGFLAYLYYLYKSRISRSNFSPALSAHCASMCDSLGGESLHLNLPPIQRRHSVSVFEEKMQAENIMQF